MRIEAQRARRVGDLQLGEQVAGRLARFAGPDRAMDLQDLDELRAYGPDRVERRQRILEDMADLAAPDPAEPPLGRTDQLLALEADAAAEAGIGREQADDAACRGRLAGARLADHAEHLALGHLEADRRHGGHGSEPNRKLLHLEQGRITHVKPIS